MTPTAEATLSRPKRPGKPGRKREAPSPPPQGDYGPDTPAQMANAKVLPLYERGGDWKRKRRDNMLDILARRHGPKGTSVIDARQRTAGFALFDAYEATIATGCTPWMRPYVDGGQYGEAHINRVEAQQKYQALESLLPQDTIHVIRWVVCFQRPLGDYASEPANRNIAREKLRRGLAKLATDLGY